MGFKTWAIILIIALFIAVVVLYIKNIKYRFKVDKLLDMMSEEMTAKILEETKKKLGVKQISSKDIFNNGKEKIKADLKEVDDETKQFLDGLKKFKEEVKENERTNTKRRNKK